MTEVDLGGHPGVVVRPRGARALYVFAHGAGAGMRHGFMVAVAEALATRKIATVRWDLPFMAAGKARPDPAPVAEAAVREVWAAVAAHARDLPRFAGGKSFGGRMTSRAHAATPSGLPGLRGLVFLGFPLHPAGKPAIERAAHLATTTGDLLFVQGDRDALADLALLRPVVAGIGARATLQVVQHADHGFDVLVRSGRTPAEVIAELADTVASWMIARV